MRPIQIETSVATKTPAKTAPTLIAPILRVENAEACMTSSAVRGPVRSIAPLVVAKVSRYESTAAVVSRITLTTVGRSRPGTSRHRVGRPGHARLARCCHRM